MPHPKNTAEDFWLRVNKGEGCWEYQSPRKGDWKNYPQVRYMGKYWQTNRLVWLLTYGEDPAELFVCHHCDNPKCVRPDHLFLGTADDNNKDKARKGRGKSGGYKLRKLTDTQLMDAFNKYHSGQASMNSLAVEYGLSQSKLSKWFSKMREQMNIDNPFLLRPVDIETVKSMREEKASMRTIAAHFGVSEQRIWNVINENFPELRKRMQSGITLARV